MGIRYYLDRYQFPAILIAAVACVMAVAGAVTKDVEEHKAANERDYWYVGDLSLADAHIAAGDLAGQKRIPIYTCLEEPVPLTGGGLRLRRDNGDIIVLSAGNWQVVGADER